MTRRAGAAFTAASAAAIVLVATVGVGSASLKVPAPRIELRAVLAIVPPESAVSTTLGPADRADAAAKVASCDQAGVAQLPVVPTTMWRTAETTDCVVYPERDGPARYFLGPAKVTSSDVKRARAAFTSGQGWTVVLHFTPRGSRAWDALAQQQFHEQVAMTLSGRVVSAPTIQPADETFTSFGGVAVISSDFTRKQAQAVAVLAGPRNGR